MAIANSNGYPGSIGPVEWAQYADELGEKYGVRDADDWKVSTVVGPDRTVAVAAGWGFGRGVLDYNNATVNLQCAVGSGAAGTVRYDLIVARRTWGTTNTTTFVIVQGTSSPTIPTTRLHNPGVQDDQPLALVKITTGSTVPVIEADLRTWPSKVNVANDLRALADPTYGDQALIGAIRYRRTADASGNGVWTPDSPIWTAYTPTLTATNGAPAMDAANRSGRYRKVGDVYEVEARFTWSRLGTGEGLGAGDYYFGLPVAASSWYLGDQVLGSASYVDVGVSTYGECNAALVENAGSRMYFGYHGTKVGASYPTTPNNGDIYSFRVSYQGAS